jgi:hypothetical protein
MSAPFSLPRAWRDRLRTPAQLLGLGLLVYGCNRGVEAWQAAAHRRRVAPCLEAADPRRRRLGLVPLAGFKPPRYVDRSDYDGTERVVYAPRPGPSTYVFNDGKVLTLDANTGAWLAEEDKFVFANPDTADPRTPRFYFLACKHVFAAPAARRPGWRVRLSDRDIDFVDNRMVYPGDTTLTRAQADSVLRSWHQLVRQDSLARLARRAPKG